MLKNLTRWRKTGALCAMLSLPIIAHAQALPTATSMDYLQVGGGYTEAKPDYGGTNTQGFSGFVDYDYHKHIGAELTLHDASVVTRDSVGEDSYLLGPRFLLPIGRFTLYGKVMAGMGTLVLKNPGNNTGTQRSSYFAYALGGGLDFRANRHIVIRAFDFETQHWSYKTGLTPTVITIGAAYRF